MRIFFVDNVGKQHPLVLVVYKFDAVSEHKVFIRPHGLSKSNQPYCRTMKSTKKKLQHELASASPKDVVHKVMKEKGGLLNAKSSSELPLSYQQVYNINHKRKIEANSCGQSLGYSRGKGRDLLYIMMEQCKLAQKMDRYVQEVTCAPEPMAILATQQQLQDLNRFCCNSQGFCIMGVDPTFNLGEFSVTPIVYQHLLVKDAKHGTSPWLLGPILIHYKKEFRNYNFLFSSLIGLMKDLKNVKAVGTDGEVNIIDAAHQQFQGALLLRCFRHLQTNIERYLHGKQLPPHC